MVTDSNMGWNEQKTILHYCPFNDLEGEFVLPEGGDLFHGEEKAAHWSTKSCTNVDANKIKIFPSKILFLICSYELSKKIYPIFAGFLRGQ